MSHLEAFEEFIVTYQSQAVRTDGDSAVKKIAAAV